MQAFRCATWRLRSASRRRRSTTIFSDKIDFYRHAVDHAIKQVTDSIEADGAHSGRHASREAAPHHRALFLQQRRLHTLSARVHRHGPRECAQPREVRLQPRDRQADENLRAVRERYRHGLVSHTEVLDAETLRLSSDMNAMYVHYDAVLAGLRLRHAMSEL